MLPNSSGNKRKVGSSAFVNNKRWVKEPGVSTSQEGKEEYGHLSQFLQDQIISRKQQHGSGASRGSRRSVANNAMIEKAAKLKNDADAMSELME